MLEEQEEADAIEEKDSPYDPIHGLNQNRARKLYPGEKSPERISRQIPTEVYMRRKELLDDIQQLLDIVEPGLSRRRGRLFHFFKYVFDLTTIEPVYTNIVSHSNMHKILGLSLFETATCHLQLGKQLHEAGRFSRSDFLMLLSSETKSLEECLSCLAHSKEGTQEAITRYRAQGAILESEANSRMLLQDTDVAAASLESSNLAKEVK